MRLLKSICAAVVGCLLWASGAAAQQYTPAQLLALINTNLPTNGQNYISAAGLRQVLDAMVTSTTSLTGPNTSTINCPAIWGNATGTLLTSVCPFTVGGTSGSTMVVGASVTGGAGLNIAPGVAPTTPNNGDVWATSTGIFAEINGSTQQLNAFAIGTAFQMAYYTGSTSVGSSPAITIAAGVPTITTPTISGTLTGPDSVTWTTGGFQSPTLVTPTVSLGTGSAQSFLPTSANTGYSNQAGIVNSGTASNGATVASLVANLTGSGGGYAQLIVTGGASPTASLATSTGVTGGFSISAGAGTLSIAAPTVTGSFTATGLVTLADMATQAANTVLVNATSGTASPTAQSVSSCSTAGSALNWTTNTGFGCNTSITAAAVPASGLTGSTLAAGVTASSLTSVGTLTSLVANGAISNTGTALPTPAAGTLGIGGEASVPTFAANGEAAIYITSTTGGITLMGKGSTSDYTLLNSGGTTVCTNPTGAVSLSCGFFIPTSNTAPTVGMYLPSAGLLGLAGTTIELFSGATDELDYGVTSASKWTSSPIWNFTNSTDATTVAAAGVVLSGGLAVTKTLEVGTNIYLKNGSNTAAGTFTCSSGGSIVVSNTNVATSDAIIISIATVNVLGSATPYVKAISAATSFTALCTTNDTSVYNYAIIKNRAS